MYICMLIWSENFNFQVFQCRVLPRVPISIDCVCVCVCVCYHRASFVASSVVGLQSYMLLSCIFQTKVTEVLLCC